MLLNSQQPSVPAGGPHRPPIARSPPSRPWSQTNCSQRTTATSTKRCCCSSSSFTARPASHSQGDVAHQGQSSEVRNLENGEPDNAGHVHATPTVAGGARKASKVLCLSNGHGEDVIAVRVLNELQHLASSQGEVIGIEALPLVGTGHAYSRAGIATVGPSRTMPSGGFIYMNFLHLIGDLQAGLLSLTLQQWRTVVDWKTVNPDGLILAVGDVFPLALAWLAYKHHKGRSHQLVDSPEQSPGYAFIGTAKSEFYLRNEDGELLRQSLDTTFFPGSVYLPWERHMMSDAQCGLVFPRDSLTVKYLKQQLPLHARDKVHDLGNPMMDGLDPTGILNFLGQQPPAHQLTILPGSREPEVHANWQLLLRVVEAVLAKFGNEPILFFTPIVPTLEPAEFTQALSDLQWQCEGVSLLADNTHAGASVEALGAGPLMHPTAQSTALQTWPANDRTPILVFAKGHSKMFLMRGGFSDCAQRADGAIAMAGTAAEQLVGLGKPVFTIPGKGPQFSYAFAEAQSRLLGKSIVLCSGAAEVADRVHNILTKEDRFDEFRKNGFYRMGPCGAAKRIARQLWMELI